MVILPAVCHGMIEVIGCMMENQVSTFIPFPGFHDSKVGG